MEASSISIAAGKGLKNLTPNRKIVLVATTIFLISMLVYLPSMHNDFIDVWDDGIYIVENHHIRILDLKFLQWAFTSFYAGNWHPVTWISHALDVALWGLDARMHHLTSIVLHAMNTVLVFLLVVGLISRVRKRDIPEVPHQAGTGILPGFITALFFGLHPIHVESVAWMAERKDLLCAFFVLLSILGYLQYTAADSRRRKGVSFFLALMFFTLAVMSKPMAVTLPVILILLDIYPLKHLGSFSLKGSRLLLVEKIPFFLLSLVSGVLTIIAQHSSGATAPLVHHGFMVRFVNTVRTLVFYLWKMAFPFELAPFYPFPLHFDPTDAIYIVSFMIVLGITIYCIRMWKKEKHVWLIVWSIYVISLLPVIGIIQVSNQAAADRYTYLPGIAPFLLIGLGFEWLWVKGCLVKAPHLLRPLLFICGSLIFGCLSYLTVRQIKVWTNGEVLWKYEIGIFPDSVALAYINLGCIYSEKGLLDEAIQLYERALKINPNYLQAFVNLGNEYRKKGDAGRAEEFYQKAIKMNPEYAGARLHIAEVWMNQGLIEKAVLEYEKILDTNPTSAEAHYGLGVACYGKGKLDEAIMHYQKALDLKPGYAEAYYNLGVAYGSSGMPDQALSAYSMALRFGPEKPEIHNNLGSIYGAKGMLDDALREFQKVLELDPENATAFYNLSVVYSMKKQYAMAVQYCDKALKHHYPVPNAFFEALEPYRLSTVE